MTCFRNKAGVAPILVFAVLLIAAQSIVSTHEFRHDTGKAQNQVCTTCVAASQLGSACVDSCASGEIEAYSPTTGSSTTSSFNSIHALVVRQRGPPAAL